MEQKMYSMKEIAKALNVSRATIDRVIHNRGGIGEETVRKVQRFLEEVNYKPNKVGRALSKKMKKKIYFLYHVPQNEFFGEIQRGIDTALHDIGDYGLSIEVMFSDSHSEEQIERINEMVQKDADAIVLSPFEPFKFAKIINELTLKGVPVVTFNNDVPNSSRLFYVGTDYYQSGRVAADVMGRIIKSGEVAVFIGEGNDWQVRSRLSGFKDVLQSFPNIQLTEYEVGLPHTQSSYRLAKKILSEKDIKGIFPLQTGIRGIVQAKQELQNNHVEVITFDLSSFTRDCLSQSLITATICQGPFYQGYYPVRLLFDFFWDQKKPEQEVYLTKLDVIFKENLQHYIGGFKSI